MGAMNDTFGRSIVIVPKPRKNIRPAKKQFCNSYIFLEYINRVRLTLKLQMLWCMSKSNFKGCSLVLSSIYALVQTQHVCPDISSFCVNSEDASKTSPKGWHGRAMSMQQVIIVLKPIGKEMVWDNSPASFPYLVMKKRKKKNIS